MDIEESYRFFVNKKCEYYPCHNKIPLNCLFCFCPLYYMKNCGGSFVITRNVKDCSNCLIPHKYNGYDHIIKKLKKSDD